MKPENESIRDKLKSLGVQLGAGNLQPTAKTARYRIEDVIRATEEKTPVGSTLLYEEKFPTDYQHGHIRLSDYGHFKMITRWAGLDVSQASNIEKVLFIDTETSGLSHSAGTFAFLIGVGYFRGKNFQLKQFIMSDPSLEPALLAALARHIDPFHYVVSYNGKSFDIPLLTNRYILNRIPTPFVNKDHIDLLHLARKLWRNRLPSRRLGDLETNILSFKRSNDDIPGWLVPEIYKDYLNTGDARPLSGVFYHNAMDIISLAAVFVHISKLLNEPEGENIADLDLVAIGNIFEDMGSFEHAKEIYRTCLGKNLPETLFVQMIMRYAAIHKKAGEWRKAAALWEISSHQSIDSCIELAKYYEHQKQDYLQAIHWTRMAIEHNKNYNSNIDFLQPELEHRLNRLIKKHNKKASQIG